MHHQDKQEYDSESENYESLFDDDVRNSISGPYIDCPDTMQT
jgi:hypothetical protein